MEARREARRQAPYERWNLVTLSAEARDEQGIYWQDVIRILDNDLERWKLVKAAVSASGTVNRATLKSARSNGWVVVDREKREIRFDYRLVPEGQIIWSSGDAKADHQSMTGRPLQGRTAPRRPVPRAAPV